jgi:signal transduction histidine kinase
MYENQFLPPTFQVPVPLSPNFSDDLVKESEQRLTYILIVINGSIFILAGGLGYFLAGKTLRPIQEMLEEQNRFISDSSHELRTPLTSLKTAMEVSLRDKQLKLIEAKQIISESIEEVDKLQALSDGLLQLAQYQKPKSFNQFTELAISEIIEKSIKKVTPLAKAKSITINNNISEVILTGNLFALTDLLVILLDNAIKYTPAKKEIFLSSKQRDGMIQIMVQDQGIGVEESEIPHLFDRFYRADSARSRVTAGGYGLGLSIAKQIVENHHGSIIVKKNSNEGSTFIIQLPLKQTRITRPKIFS